mmetsp:Transcript_20832/g.67524  ORF Transcript_20832/g.67524 Transcript_20832/m.67524 type:complete len:265 (+) Transcript_20832:152-946(+)
MTSAYMLVSNTSRWYWMAVSNPLLPAIVQTVAHECDDLRGRARAAVLRHGCRHQRQTLLPLGLRACVPHATAICLVVRLLSHQRLDRAQQPRDRSGTHSPSVAVVSVLRRTAHVRSGAVTLARAKEARRVLHATGGARRRRLGCGWWRRRLHLVRTRDVRCIIQPAVRAPERTHLVVAKHPVLRRQSVALWQREGGREAHGAVGLAAFMVGTFMVGLGCNNKLDAALPTWRDAILACGDVEHLHHPLKGVHVLRRVAGAGRVIK